MSIGRPLEYDPDIALDAAMQLFWRKGYEATSLQNLLSSMGLSKSSFYQAFKSKHALFHKSIQHYRRMLLNDLQSRLKQSDSSRAFIEELFNELSLETSGINSHRGCLLMNTANELAQTDKVIATLISDSLDQLTMVFEQSIIQAQQENTISRDKDPKSLALYFVSSMSGLKNMVKAGVDSKTIQNIAKTTLTALD